MILLTQPHRSTLRTREDLFLLADLADQLIDEAGLCGDIRSGSWLFLARLGEGVPVTCADIEHRLWTAQADINPDTRPPLLREGAPPGRVMPHQGSGRVHARDADAIEFIAGLNGLAGIAICVDRDSPRNDALIRALTYLLEPHLPDSTGPVPWYGNPPSPPVAEARA